MYKTGLDQACSWVPYRYCAAVRKYCPTLIAVEVVVVGPFFFVLGVLVTTAAAAAAAAAVDAVVLL